MERGGRVCDKVNPALTSIDGMPLDLLASYRVTVNSFLADGGDSFPILVSGTNRLGGEVDTDALERYIATNSPVSPGPREPHHTGRLGNLRELGFSGGFAARIPRYTPALR